MSKSLGNGVDPMDVIDKYGADSLRYFLATSSAPGMDLRYDEEKVSSTWNFINKLWNASRFVISNIEGLTETDIDINTLDLTDKWLLTKLNKTIKDVTKYMEKYEFHNAGNLLYNFIWSDFCDNYIEFSKSKLDIITTKNVLIITIKSIIKMLHPFMPYVTEEIYTYLPKKETSIMLSSYPKYNRKYLFNDVEQQIDYLINDLTSIRNLKATNNITKNAMIKIKTSKELFTIYQNALKINNDNIVFDQPENTEEYSYKSSLIDIKYYEKGKEINKDTLLEEINKLKQSIAKRENLLKNENYVNKAPEHVVSLDRQKLKEEQTKLQNLENML